MMDYELWMLDCGFVSAERRSANVAGDLPIAFNCSCKACFALSEQALKLQFSLQSCALLLQIWRLVNRPLLTLHCFYL